MRKIADNDRLQDFVMAEISMRAIRHFEKVGIKLTDSEKSLLSDLGFEQNEDNTYSILIERTGIDINISYTEAEAFVRSRNEIKIKSLPLIEGTEKQIKYANDLRNAVNQSRLETVLENEKDPSKENVKYIKDCNIALNTTEASAAINALRNLL